MEPKRQRINGKLSMDKINRSLEFDHQFERSASVGNCEAGILPLSTFVFVSICTFAII